MSIKQEFMDMLLISQRSDILFRDSISSQLSELTLSSTVSNIIIQIEEISEINQSLNILKNQLLKLKKIYIEIEYVAKKICSLNYSKCIKFASSEELNSIDNEVKQYISIFDSMFTKCKVYLDSDDLFVSDYFPCVQTTLRNQLVENCSIILNVLKEYLIRIENCQHINSSIIKFDLDDVVSLNIRKKKSPVFRQFRDSSISDLFCKPQIKSLSDTERSELHQSIISIHEKSFSSLLFEYIDETGMTDAQVYNAIGISKQVFSNLRSGKQHSLKKKNIVSICIVLHLNIEKTLKLLASCGYGLSEYTTFDRIISFCISKGCYDIFEINELLVDYNQQTICGFDEN